MPIVMGNLKRLELLKTKPELREKLWHNVNRLQQGLRDRGFDIGTTNSPVTPVFLQGGIVRCGTTHLRHEGELSYILFCRGLSGDTQRADHATSDTYRCTYRCRYR